MCSLVVASSPLVAQMLAGLLHQCSSIPFAPLCASSAEACAAIQRHKPHLLVLTGDIDPETSTQLGAALLAAQRDARMILLNPEKALQHWAKQPDQAERPPIEACPSWAELLRLALRFGGGRTMAPEGLPDPRLLELMAPRERTVLALLRLGKVSREIADDLGLKVQTVETDRKRLSARLGVSGARLIRLAVLYQCTGHLSTQRDAQSQP